MKKSFLKALKRTPVVPPMSPPSTKRINQSPLQVICNYCHRSGHTKQICRLAKGQCLACGSSDHSLSNCTIKRPNPTPFVTPPRAPPTTLPARAAPLALATLTEQGTSGPTGRRVPLVKPPINQQSGQGGTRPEVWKNQTYNLTTKETKSLGGKVTGII